MGIRSGMTAQARPVDVAEVFDPGNRRDPHPLYHRLRAEQPIADGEEEHEYEVSEDRAVLEPGFRALDERERRILHLRFFEGLTQSQIAQQVGISQMHVSRLIRRSLEKIRAEIAEEEPAEPSRAAQG